MLKYKLLPKSTELSVIFKQIKLSKNMNVSDAFKEYNKITHPNPTFLNKKRILEFYGNKINERKLKSWAFDDKAIRLEYHTTVATTKNTIYDPSNPKHISIGQGGKIEYYALEDFEAFLQFEATKDKNKLQIAEINTNQGKKVILRDFRKKNPTQRQVENLSDSFGTFVAFLAQRKIEEEVDKYFDEETAKKVKLFLNDIIPPKL